MRERILVTLVILLALSGARWAEAQTIPLMINYQGKVEVAGVPHNGPGYFKFSLVDDPTNPTVDYWTNDGSDPPGAGGEPTNRVTLSVNQGLFSVKLGDTNLTNMTPLTLPVFNSPSVYLRVWFSSDGTAFEQLIPDRQLASVPYAYRAETADKVEADGITTEQIADGTIGSEDLEFDPATQSELDAHKGSSDHDGRYFTETELSGPGTINAAGNPVDWTKLKGVPADIVDGDQVGITSETDPTAVTLQASTPGTVQSGHLNITGTGILGSLSVDSPTLVVDATNDRVGIGTAAASARLDVQGGSTSGQVVIMGADISSGGSFATQLGIQSSGPVGSPIRLVFFDNANGTASIESARSVSSVSGYLAMNTRKSGGPLLEKMRIDADGNVGIGTTTPQSRLHVSSNYIQFPTISGAAPPAADCDAASEAGRVVVRTDGATNLYICTGTGGWVGK